MCEMSRIHGELHEVMLTVKWMGGTRTEPLSWWIEREEMALEEHP